MSNAGRTKEGGEDEGEGVVDEDDVVGDGADVEKGEKPAAVDSDDDGGGDAVAAAVPNRPPGAPPAVTALESALRALL